MPNSGRSREQPLVKLVGLGANASPSSANTAENGSIVVAAGWGSNDATLDVALVLNATDSTGTAKPSAFGLGYSRKIRNVRIVAQLRGVCRTRWDAAGRLVDAAQSTAKVVATDAQFLDVTRNVFDSKDAVYPDPLTGKFSFPFRITLPPVQMPPSFTSPGGSISYSLKCTLIYQEGLNLLRSGLEVDSPVLVYIPSLSQNRLLSNPGALSHQSDPALSATRVSYALSLSRRVVRVGDSLEADVAVTGCPQNVSIASLTASLHQTITYLSLGSPSTNAAGKGVQAKLHRSISATSETFDPPIDMASRSSAPLLRRFYLNVDPQHADGCFESPLISIQTTVRLEITCARNADAANVSVDIPVLIVPLTAEQTLNSAKLTLQRIGAMLPAASQQPNLNANQFANSSSPVPTSATATATAQPSMRQHPLSTTQILVSSSSTYSSSASSSSASPAAQTLIPSSNHMSSPPITPGDASVSMKTAEHGFFTQQSKPHQYPAEDGSHNQHLHSPGSNHEGTAVGRYSTGSNPQSQYSSSKHFVETEGAADMTVYPLGHLASKPSTMNTTESTHMNIGGLKTLPYGTTMSRTSTDPGSVSRSRSTSLSFASSVSGLAGAIACGDATNARRSTGVEAQRMSEIVNRQKDERPQEGGHVIGNVMSSGASLSNVSFMGDSILGYYSGGGSGGDGASFLSRDGRGLPGLDWGVEKVAEWVKRLGASNETAALFVEQQVDGTVLMMLSTEDLTRELQVTTLGLRHKIVATIERMRALYM
ncbi:hypothetical protein HDU81_003664 [Chytriomyces hyalinus]|nr:hypothetical protein HDU81_003664 [Chytriomyces hyalinus]